VAQPEATDAAEAATDENEEVGLHGKLF
jgi:hypothetical protein